MKRQLLICLLVLFSLPSFSQEKAALTKEETVNYIKKKLLDISSYNVTGSDRYFFNSINLNEIRLNFSYNNFGPYDYDNSWCGPMFGPDYNTNVCTTPYTYHKETYTYEFEITKIYKIENDTVIKSYNKNIGFIKITFSANIVTKTTYYLHFINKNVFCKEDNAYSELCVPRYSTKSELVNYILIPFVTTDSSNFNKIKKAIEHLRDLCKAEDDPFGE